MKKRRLGDSDLEVSEIALGSWLTYSGGVEQEQAEACTRAAYEAGINFFDTANVYGQGASEEAWGKILSAYPRDSYILATKVFFQASAGRVMLGPLLKFWGENESQSQPQRDQVRTD